MSALPGTCICIVSSLGVGMNKAAVTIPRDVFGGQSSPFCQVHDRAGTAGSTGHWYMWL